MSLPFHPLANLFPLIEGAEFAALVEDIRANGVRDPIVLLDGQILDGRNRYRAGVAAGFFTPSEEVGCRPHPQYLFDVFPTTLTGEDPLAYVLSKNLTRRHLSESQRAMVAARIASLGVGRPAETPSSEGISAEEAAERLNVGTASVERARKVVRDGAPELQRGVEAGTVSVSAAADLASLPIAEQQRIIESADPKALAGVIKQVRAEKQAAKRERRDSREVELAARQRALPAKRYGVILADPEWRFEPWSRESGMDRAPENHYPTSTTDVIAARPVGEIAADDAVLFLWATAPMLPQALEVMTAWGFGYVTHLVWDKGAIGTGYWVRGRHELLLIGTRGNVPAPAMGTQWPSVIAGERGRHSEKPDAQYELIEGYFPNLPKIELNARSRRESWDAWGLESPEGQAAQPLPHVTMDDLGDYKGLGAIDGGIRITGPAVADFRARGLATGKPLQLTPAGEAHLLHLEAKIQNATTDCGGVRVAVPAEGAQ